MKTKFAVVGTGMMGCEHIRNLAHLPDAELIAVSDPEERSLKWAKSACGDRFTPTYHTDYRDLLDMDLDAVVIASPNFTHIDLVRDFAETPFHLLLEKPMCTTLKDCREVIALDEARGAMIWVAMEYRYMSATSAFAKELDDVGDLSMLFIREHRGPFLKKVGDWNRFNKNSGGTLVEKCCHFFDLMNLLIKSRPIATTASGAMSVNHIEERYHGEKPDILDNAYVIIDYENGVRACLDLCMFAEGGLNEQEIVATGSIGKLEIHIPENRLNRLPRKPTVSATEKSIIIPDDPDIKFMGLHHGASFLEQRDFIAAIANNQLPAVNTHDGYWAVAVGVAAQASIATGQRVEVEPL